MSTSDIKKTQQAALHATLWNMANDLRGANEILRSGSESPADRS